MEQHLQLADNCTVDYYPKFLSQIEADELFQLVSLKSGVLPWKQDQVTIGKSNNTTLEPRFTCFLGESDGLEYIYSQKRNTATKWPPLVQSIKERTERLVGYKFNVALLNYYQDGSHHVGWHSDSELGLVEGSPIVSLSLGATRTFQLRHLTESAISTIQSFPGGIESAKKEGVENVVNISTLPQHTEVCRSTVELLHRMSIDDLKSYRPGHNEDMNRQIPLHHGDLLIMGGNLQKFWRHRIPKDKECNSPRVVFTFRAVTDPFIINGNSVKESETALT